MQTAKAMHVVTGESTPRSDGHVKPMRLRFVIAFAAFLSVTANANAEKWKELEITGQIVSIGQLYRYQLLLNISNVTDQPVKIKIPDLYNPSRDIFLTYADSGRPVKSYVTGGVPYAGDVDKVTRWVEIGPHSWAHLLVPLHGISVFDKAIAGQYKGVHQIFGKIIPEFIIKRDGTVINLPEKQQQKNGNQNSTK